MSEKSQDLFTVRMSTQMKRELKSIVALKGLKMANVMEEMVTNWMKQQKEEK